MKRPWLEANGNTFPYRKLIHVASLKARIGWQSLRTDEFVDDGPYCVTGTDFKNGKIDWTTAYHVSTERYEMDQNIQLTEGDLLVTKDGTIGKVAVVHGMKSPATLNSGVFVVRPKINDLSTDFLGWVIRSKVFDDFVAFNFSGSTINHLYQNVFETFRFPFPDLATQRQIADFLDRETARIDLLIEKKQQLVKLLGEKAKSVNELFFLNACASDTQPLHRLYRVITGKTPSRTEDDNFSVEEGLPWATPTNLGFLAPITSTKELLTDKGCDGQPVVDAGTVLLNGIGASVGKIGIAGTRLSFNQQIHALIAKKRVLADRFLFFQLLTLKEQLVLLANSTTIPILNAERLGRLELRIFESEMQHQHCETMDVLLKNEEQTARKISSSIDRLKEYRSALITSAVTGQIDTTNHAKSGAADRKLDAIEEVCE